MSGTLTMLPAACAGFLLAVLWMDLIFDAQVVAHRNSGDELPEPVLASIAGYYRRATTTSKPMSMLIVIVMAVLVIALAVTAVDAAAPVWLLGASIVSAGGPILLALTRTVPNAVRLGKRTDTTAEQSRLARAVFTDHVVCFALVIAFLCLWLTAAA
jgi:hypothetical protein